MGKLSWTMLSGLRQARTWLRRRLIRRMRWDMERILWGQRLEEKGLELLLEPRGSLHELLMSGAQRTRATFCWLRNGWCVRLEWMEREQTVRLELML